MLVNLTVLYFLLKICWKRFLLQDWSALQNGCRSHILEDPEPNKCRNSSHEVVHRVLSLVQRQSHWHLAAILSSSNGSHNIVSIAPSAMLVRSTDPRNLVRESESRFSLYCIRCRTTANDQNPRCLLVRLQFGHFSYFGLSMTS